MTRYEPKEILVEFLRARVTDPRGRHTTTSDSFTGDDIETTFTLTPSTSTKVQAINSVTVASSTKSKWQDYYIDLQNQQIIFKTAPATGEAIVVSYEEGSTSWIYPDKPRKDLSPTSFPRMNTLIVTSPGKRAGNYKADVEHNVHFQLDIWTKADIGDSAQIFTINGREYEGDKLASVLGHSACDALKQYIDDIYPMLYDYQPITGPRDLTFDSEHQSFHSIVEFSLKMLNPGANL